MEPWVLPTIVAGSIVGCISIWFIFFMYNRAFKLAPKNKPIPPPKKRWGYSVDDTSSHLMSETVLSRFILFGLNLTSLLWSTEHNLIHTNRHLVYIRRGLNIIAVFTGLFAIGIADVIYVNWFCYAENTSIDDYNEGLCWNSSATINKNETKIEIITSYHEMSKWIWISNAIFAGSIFLSMAIHAYLMYFFVYYIRFGIEGIYTGIIECIDDHTHVFQDIEEKLNLKKYIRWALHSHIEGNSKESFLTHGFNLHRLTILFFDPIAILGGFVHIILGRSDLAIFSMLNSLLMVGTWFLYYSWAIPRYEETCCYYDDTTRMGSAGLCNDPFSSLAHDPFRKECTGYNFELVLIISFGILQIVIGIVMWLYSVILFQYIILKGNSSNLQALKEKSKTVHTRLTAYHEENLPDKNDAIFD